MAYPSIDCKTSERDLRIDCFRGVALLVILVDHIEGVAGIRWLSCYTLHAFGPADALDVFVFLSGYVFGTVYSKAWSRGGYWACQRKGLRRAGQLYLANNAMYGVVITAATTLSLEQTLFTRFSLVRENTGPQRSLDSLWAVVSIYHPLLGLEVLPLYAVFVLAMPVLLGIMLRKGASMTLLLSYSFYAATQCFTAFTLPIMPASMRGDTWFYNPFAWQFLFAIAMVLAVQRDSTARKFLKCKSAMIASASVVVVVSAIYIQRQSGRSVPIEGILPWTHKTTLGPLRLAYFLCLVHIAATCLQASAAFWQSKVAAPLVYAGQHSLKVFCVGVLLTYVCVGAQELQQLSHLEVQVAELGAVGCSLAFACCLTRIKKFA